jgi:hypothetical protein
VPKKTRMGLYDLERMEAAYTDVRDVANQLEDQLTRAFEVRVIHCTLLGSRGLPVS